MRPLILCALAITIISFISSCQKGFTIDEVPVVIDSLPIDSLPTNDTSKILQIISITPDSAKAGDTVFITGRGFLTVGLTGNISINGLPLSILSLTDTTLSVKLPEGFTSGPVSIITADTTIISIINIIAKTQDSVITNNSWKPKASISYPDPAYVDFFSIGNKGYQYIAGLKEYDPIANTWTNKGPTPVSKRYGFTLVCNGKLYLGAGAKTFDEDIDTTLSKQVWEYNPATDQWTRKADFPGTARVQPFFFSTSTYGYVGGGDTTLYGNGAKDFWRYDPAKNEWKRMNDYGGTVPPSFEKFRGFTINNKGYVLEAGCGPLSAFVSSVGNKADLWMYNEANDTWTPKKSFDKVPGFISATVFTIQNKAYLTVGVSDPPTVNGQLVKNDFWIYNADTDQWSQGTSSPSKERLFGQSFSIGNKGYVGLGTESYVEDIHDDFWEYTPE